MNLVIDSNVLFAAAIKESKTAEAIFHRNLDLFSPSFILDECTKYMIYLERKTQWPDFPNIMKKLLDKITLIDQSLFVESLQIATEISPDLADSPFVALAIHLNIPLWTNDKQLINIKEIRIFTTKQVIEYLGI
ncbi:MAG: PIN domain-containing protein [Nanoarchaeota archaeon]